MESPKLFDICHIEAVKAENIALRPSCDMTLMVNAGNNYDDGEMKGRGSVWFYSEIASSISLRQACHL